jgi:hypothetical protein
LDRNAEWHTASFEDVMECYWWEGCGAFIGVGLLLTRKSTGRERVNSVHELRGWCADHHITSTLLDEAARFPEKELHGVSNEAIRRSSDDAVEVTLEDLPLQGGVQCQLGLEGGRRVETWKAWEEIGPWRVLGREFFAACLEPSGHAIDGLTGPNDGHRDILGATRTAEVQGPERHQAKADVHVPPAVPELQLRFVQEFSFHIVNRGSWSSFASNPLS